MAIALPLNKYTMGLIGERELRALKRGAIVVNVGRGDVVREEDLYRCLRRGRTLGLARTSGGYMMGMRRFRRGLH
ncbi:NAD(P)-dependent oxidoreductase [Vulcanisaeta sp. JCM 14467]|uniref:NAD(P)-dependent oxidoreductase n=1 Tax=Vulcanisaeta sp. JCM 14467 TaxID=1295370 RepID=UPI002091F772|nr:NAD(P)-dependent oxidoreductase [Vulcanisaeta sp. JCM 14467]